MNDDPNLDVSAMQPDAVYRIGRDVSVGSPPRRVVSLVPALTESLFALDLGNRVVGVTRQCIHPAQNIARLPRVGDTSAISVPLVLALRPDLILASAEENTPSDIDALKAAGLSVWTTDPRTVRDAFNLLWAIMDIFETPTRVEAIRAMEWQCDWLERLDETRTHPCRVFIPLTADPLTTVNADTFVHDLLRVCGGYTVFAGLADRRAEVTLADLEAAQPDVILLPGAPFPFTAEYVEAFGTLDVPAARTGQIHLIEDTTLLFWQGTRMARAFRMLPDLLCVANTLYTTDTSSQDDLS